MRAVASKEKENVVIWSFNIGALYMSIRQRVFIADTQEKPKGNSCE
jgi:hypothetical protein